MSFILRSRLSEIVRETKERAAVHAAATAENVEARIKESMAGPKSGHVYQEGEGGTHQASAPGEAPAIDEETLVKSVQTEKDGETRHVVGSDDPKSPLLEFGTGRTAPRPSFVPAAEAERPDFEQGLKDLVR